MYKKTKEKLKGSVTDAKSKSYDDIQQDGNKRRKEFFKLARMMESKSRDLIMLDA